MEALLRGEGVLAEERAGGEGEAGRRGFVDAPEAGLWPEAERKSGCPRAACFRRVWVSQVGPSSAQLGQGFQAPNSKPDL